MAYDLHSRPNTRRFFGPRVAAVAQFVRLNARFFYLLRTLLVVVPSVLLFLRTPDEKRSQETYACETSRDGHLRKPKGNNKHKKRKVEKFRASYFFVVALTFVIFFLQRVSKKFSSRLKSHALCVVTLTIVLPSFSATNGDCISRALQKLTYHCKFRKPFISDVKSPEIDENTAARRTSQMMCRNPAGGSTPRKCRSNTVPDQN